jgi:hypothetical protein
LGWHDTTRSKETPKQPESEGPDMPRSDHPPYNWPTQRHYLDQALKHLSAFTDNMRTFLELNDEAEAQELALSYDTTPVIVCMDDLSDDTDDKTSMTKRAKQVRPSRDDFPNARKTWTTEEDNQLWAALLLGHNYQWIAHHLSRTPRAIQRRVDKLQGTGQL